MVVGLVSVHYEGAQGRGINKITRQEIRAGVFTLCQKLPLGFLGAEWELLEEWAKWELLEGKTMLID